MSTYRGGGLHAASRGWGWKQLPHMGRLRLESERCGSSSLSPDPSSLQTPTRAASSAGSDLQQNPGGLVPPVVLPVVLPVVPPVVLPVVPPVVLPMVLPVVLPMVHLEILPMVPLEVLSVVLPEVLPEVPRGST